MGKRELLLIILFVLAGTVVYQVTAPPPAPGERSFSVARMIDMLRRHLRGTARRARNTDHHARTPSHPPFPSSASHRRTGQITVVGEDRERHRGRTAVRSNGFDEAEAERLANETALKVEDPAAGSTAHVVVSGSRTQRRLQLTLKVPARLQVMLDAAGGPLTVTGVAARRALLHPGRSSRPAHRRQHHRQPSRRRTAHLRQSRRQAVGNGSGRSARTHRWRHDADHAIAASQRQRTSAAASSLDSRGAEITLEQLATRNGVLHVNADAGSIRLKGLASEGRIEVQRRRRRSRRPSAPAVSIQSEGRARSRSRRRGGYQLDAVARPPRSAAGRIETTAARRASGPCTAAARIDEPSRRHQSLR